MKLLDFLDIRFADLVWASVGANDTRTARRLVRRAFRAMRVRESIEPVHDPVPEQVGGGW